MYNEFKLGDELNRFHEGTMTIEEELDVENLSIQELMQFINQATEKLSLNCLGILEEILFDGLRSLLKNFNLINHKLIERTFDLVLSGLRELIKQIQEDINIGNLIQKENLDSLNLYSFLIYQFIYYSENQRETEKSNKLVKGRANKNNVKSGWDWIKHQGRCFEIVYNITCLPLKRVFSNNFQIETLTGAFVKSMFLILQSSENLKSSMTRIKSYHIISLCAKEYNQSFTVQTTILQNLQYYEHLYEPMAELLDFMVNEYDYTKLVDEILSEISKKKFSYTDKIGPKSFSSFLVKLCEINPKSVNKFIGILIKQLDSESYPMRCGMIEIIGKLIEELVNDFDKDELANNAKNMSDRYFDILEERFKDVNYLVRCRVLQVCCRIADLKAKFPQRRPRLIHLIIGRLEDKTNFVRKNAIKALTKFMKTHPFSIDGGSLSFKLLESKYNKVIEELNELQSIGLQTITNNKSKDSNSILISEELEIDNSNSINNSRGEEEGTEVDKIERTIMIQSDAKHTAKMLQLQIKVRYYKDAVFFVEQLKSSISSLSQLLASTNKSEAIEAMEFFVEAKHYKLEGADEGIRKMIHLVWTKDNSDENKGTLAKVKHYFYDLYFTAPTARDNRERTNIIAKNLIDLTRNVTMADLISLEELIRLLAIDNHFYPELIEKLWSVYSTNKIEDSQSQRRGAIIILSMIGKAKHEIIFERVDLLQKIGLGEIGKNDLLIAKYSCIALQCIGGGKGKKVKGTISLNKRLPINEPLFEHLIHLIELENDDNHWFDMAEQVINTIYDLAQRPDKLCQSIIKEKYIRVRNTLKDINENGLVDPWPLSQLIFIVGHVAIKQIVFLEVVEIEQKQLRALQKHDQSEVDFENVAGTVEDEIADYIHHIREKELLFNSNSLLKMFGSLIVKICSNDLIYNDETLQIVSTLALAKFLCVSSDYCDKNLELLLKILEKSKSSIIRSNIMIALGDIATCFNLLMGENMEYMYKRLKDKELIVKKNSLMVLTHLILNGMVKVKGQIGEMAICITDNDNRISDLAKLFFTELATKDNAIYNNLPDILSYLSNPIENNMLISEDKYKIIVKFLFNFIKDKEKQSENVVDKLCHRLRHLELDRQWNDIGFCLTLIQYKSERTFKKLIEHLPSYQKRLGDSTFFNYLEEIITKVKHYPWAKDSNAFVDEFENTINTIRRKLDPDHSDELTEATELSEDNFEDEIIDEDDDM